MVNKLLLVRNHGFSLVKPLHLRIDANVPVICRWLHSLSDLDSCNYAKLALLDMPASSEKEAAKKKTI